MSRLLFGGSSDDYAVDSGGRPVTGRRVRFYTSAAMTIEITDLASDDAGTGAPLTVSTDSHGFWGPVYGPDGTAVMYAGTVGASGNPPSYVVAVYTHTQTGGGGTGVGVSSFNTRTGAVTLSKTDVTATGLVAADVGADASGAASAAQAASLQKTSNLSDVASAATARTNLGLGTAATQASTAFDAAGTAATVQTNLTAEIARAQNAEAAITNGLKNTQAAVVATANQALTGLPTVDGVTLTAGQAILLVAQTAGSQNGLWTVASGAWSRPTFFAAGTDATGTSCWVEAGTTNASSSWVVTGTTNNVVGTNVLTWQQVSGLGEVTVTSDLTKTGNQLGLATTTVTAGSYTNTNLTVDAKGRITAASAGSSSGLPSNVVTRTTAYTAVSGDFVLADATTAGFTVTLPATGTVIVKKVDGTANAVAIAAAGGGTVDGDTGGASITSPQFGAILVSTASNVWKIVAPTSAGGSNGIDGKTIRNGTGAPNNALGTDNDFYIDTTNNRLYGPKASGVWPGTYTSLVGPAGTNGTNGAIAQLQDEGTNLTVRGTVNFVGASVTATDDAANSRTNVTISSVGSGLPFGDATDGDVTLSGATTLTRDMYYNNLTINASVVVKPDGYRIFVNGTLTNNGDIQQNGTDGSNAGNGVAPGGNTRSLAQGSGGGNGNATTTGTAGSTISNANFSLGGTGGTGGTAAGGANAGGAGGSSGNMGTNWSGAQWGSSWRHPLVLLMGTQVLTIQNNAMQTGLIGVGTGGGSGASGGTAGEGGGGGGGGGFIVLNARTVINNGTIRANGGAGANGRTISGTGGGGGGGGGGGVVFVNTLSYTGSQPTANGGAGGSGSGTGAIGASGAAGTVHVMVMN